MKLLRCLVLGLATAAPPAPAQSASETALPRIATHDNVRPAGRLQDGVLSVSLWAGTGRWYPEGEGSPPREVEAFGEEGQLLTIPSPLIRAPAGTVVQATIRNTLGSPLRVHGLCDRPAACEPMTIPSGATRDVRFALGAAGTFHYWATSTNLTLPLRDGSDSQLGGAMVADEAGATPRERVFVLGLIRREPGVIGTETTVINGRSWPHNEQLHHVVGDTLRWRLVNITAAAHAMHLHGFYFTVEAAGDGMTDTRYAPGAQRQAVTEQIPPGGTIALTWTPERAGNWLFHCHMLDHMLSDAHGLAGASQHEPDPAAAGMAGLVLGVYVSGPARPAPAPDAARRKFRLTVDADTRHGTVPSYKVDITEGGSPASRINERAVPGPILVLTRGEPVAVEIVNRLNEPTAIHWHGIELESYDDGVAGFGGTVGSITPPVTANGAFTARFTPRRAGTFIYHTHWHNAAQLAGGIYGPLVVLEPGQVWNPESDHLIVLGLDGPYRSQPNEPFAVNGDTRPRPLDLKAGMAHRLRFINITGDNVNLTVQLLSGFDPMRWTLVGKDGLEVPQSQRAARPARQLVAVGETYDFELAPMPPRPASLWMELRRGNGELLFQWPVRVR
jgi:FtsP/CotA-like multicopper oxidase with cupredoxin domain